MATILGIIILIFMILTILTGTRVIKASVKFHKTLAYITLTLGLLHATGGILTYFGYL